MTDQDGKPSALNGPAAPISGAGGAPPERPQDRGTAPTLCTFAGVCTASIRDFQVTLQSLANAHGDLGVSAASGDGAGFSSKKQGAACSGQSHS